MEIHVDIDGVILGSVEEWLSDIGKPDLYETFLDYEFQNVKSYMAWLNYRTPDPYDGALDLINDLVNSGNTVFITTSRKGAHFNNFLLKYKKLSNITFKKETMIMINRCFDILIDDYPMEDHMRFAKRVIIVDQPWNRGKFNGCDRIDKFTDFDIEKYR